MNIPESVIQRKIKGELLESIPHDEFKDYPAGTVLELYECHYIVPQGDGFRTHIEFIHPVRADLFWMAKEIKILEDLGPYVPKEPQEED